MIYEREVIQLNWRGKALVLLLAPVAITAAFTRTFLAELVNALWRAGWEVRWELNRIRMFLK